MKISNFNLIAFLAISTTATYEWATHTSTTYNHNTILNIAFIIKQINQIPAGLIQVQQISCSRAMCSIQGSYARQTKWSNLKKKLEIKSLNLKCFTKKHTHHHQFFCQSL